MNNLPGISCWGHLTMCVGARDCGTNLDVSWYLMGSGKSPLMRALTQMSGVPFLDLDVFDQQHLTAYVTVGHHAVLKAVDDLMRQRNQPRDVRGVALSSAPIFLEFLPP